MLLKRIYKRVLDEKDNPIIDLHGKIVLEMDEKDKPIIDHVKVIRKSKNSKQNFSTKFILNGFKSKLVSIVDDVITLNTKPELNFKIIREPGYYCCHDDEPCGTGAEARSYLEENFKDIESPDPNNPSGYRKDNFYATEEIK